MKNMIDYSPDVRVNVSERRADFYRALPGRLEAGYIEHTEETPQREPMFQRLITFLADRFMGDMECDTYTAYEHMHRASNRVMFTTCFAGCTAAILFAMLAIVIW